MQLPASIAQAAQQSGTFNNYEDTTWTGKICVMVKASGQVSKAEFILDGNVKETQTDTSKYSSECGNLS
ncbi:MAG TPA: hypothetical protein VLG27_01795, partial [Candidatus Saccharimonadia bacterium]|nr:hypothetical protein [Candidatus Saccharimonadia bacterium]